MNRLLCIATAAVAALVAGGAQAQPYGYAGGSYVGGELPAPAYAYAGYGAPPQGGYSQAYDEGDCDSFTLLGAHAGVTVLGLNLGAGTHLGVGDDGCHRHHGHHIQYAPPPEPQGPPPEMGPPPQMGPGPCCQAPPPPPCCAYAPPPPPAPCCAAAPPPSPCCAPPPPSPCCSTYVMPPVAAQPSGYGYGW
jgi:hypothetical protein